MLRDAAIAWIGANCPNAKLRADFERQLDEALHDGVDCWFVLGKNLTRKQVPQMVHCFAGELFVFQLSEDQAKRFVASPNGLGYSRDPHPLSPPAPSNPRIQISNFDLEQQRLTADSEIWAYCNYELSNHALTDVCFRLDFSLGKLGNLINWSYQDLLLPPAGRLRLQFAPLAAAAPPRTKAYKGPAMMFLRVCTLPASDEDASFRPVISNACGTLADFV